MFKRVDKGRTKQSIGRGRYKGGSYGKRANILGSGPRKIRRVESKTKRSSLSKEVMLKSWIEKAELIGERGRFRSAESVE